jgi:hypothetical protein
MVLIYQPFNAHERISWILLRNAMAAVKKIYMFENLKIHSNGGGGREKDL